MKKPILLFVYGTLRRGCGSGAHQQYLGSAPLIASGRVRGELYLVDHYPGLVPAQGDLWVKGEIYQLPDIQSLAQLDDYEGCAEHHPHPQEYRREKIQVELFSGETLETWGYYYNWPTDKLARIVSGDFLKP